MGGIDGGLVDLVAATTPADVVRILAHCFGEGAEVYGVDHAVDHLHHYGTERTVDLEGPLRDELLSCRPCEHDGSWWLPLAERDQPVFVISMPARPDNTIVTTDTTDTARVAGSLMRLLRDRFEPVERVRRRESMSIAAELQWDLLPVGADHGNGISLAATLEPAYDVAGDLFDYAFDDGLWVYSLDGMGHGLGATTVGCAALAAIRNVRRSGGGLVRQFEVASRTVREITERRAFVTGVGCRIGIDGELTLVNAGHEPVRRIGPGGVTRLGLPVDRPLGVGASPSYRSSELPPLDVGDGLMFCSDGASAIRTGSDGPLGADRLDEILRAAWRDVPLLTVHDAVSAMLAGSSGRLDDDITIVAVRRGEPS